MGGERSGIGAATTRRVPRVRVLFAPRAIAGTARRYGLQTDASQRFERGVDHGLQFAAMERATALLLEIRRRRAGTGRRHRVDRTSARAARDRSCATRASICTLARATETDEVSNTFARLEFQPQRERGDDDVWSINVPEPPFRHRTRGGSDRRSLSRAWLRPHSRCGCRRHGCELGRGCRSTITPRGTLKRLLADLGYQEAVTYSFIDPTLSDLLDPGATTVSLTNPMSQDMSRDAHDAVSRSGEDADRECESTADARAACSNSDAAFRRSRRRVDTTGNARRRHRGDRGCRRTGRTTARRSISSTSRATSNACSNTVDITSVRYEHAARSGAASGTVGEHLERRRRCWAGSDACILNSNIGSISKPPVFLFELDGEKMLRAIDIRRIAPISRYPSVRRDLSLELARDVPAATVRACVERALGSTLR